MLLCLQLQLLVLLRHSPRAKDNSNRGRLAKGGSAAKMEARGGGQDFKRVGVPVACLIWLLGWFVDSLVSCLLGVLANKLQPQETVFWLPSRLLVLALLCLQPSLITLLWILYG